MKSKKIFILLSALALSLAACNTGGNNKSGQSGQSDTPSVQPSDNPSSDQGGEVAVTGVSLDKTELALEVGKSDTLKATVTPDNASNTKVNWASSDETVVTVSSLGKVTAVKVGTAKITATSASNPEIKAAIKKLFANIDSVEIPAGMLRQYMPRQYQRVRDGLLEMKAEALVKDCVVSLTEDYNYAVGLIKTSPAL